MPPLPDDRDLMSRERALKEARTANTSSVEAPLDCGPLELNRSQLDGWSDPQILDWDLMAAANLSHIHLL